MTLTQVDLDAAKADILDKVNSRFDALGKLVNPDPVPVPPDPPQSPQIRFACHRYYLSGPTPSADVYDLQAGQWLDLSKFPPSSPKYRYVSTARVLNDPSGDTQFLTPDRLGFFLATSGGNPITREGGNDALLNISSPDLMTAIRGNLPALLDKFDGLYLDEVDDTWKWGYPGYATTDQWASEVVWRGAFENFVSQLASAVNGLGKKIWVNLGTGQPATSVHVQNIVTKVDAVNYEYFIGQEVLGMNPLTGESFINAVTRLAYVESIFHRPMHVHVSTSSQSVVDYGFYGWLLGTEFLGSFTASRDYGGSFYKPNPTLLVAAQRLGKPVNTFYATGGILARDFSNGTIRVNNTTSKIGLLGPMTGSISLVTP